MRIFAVGDLHLSLDPSVNKPMDVFGKEWVGHTEKLHSNWTDAISEEDYVIVAGDISWALKLEEAKADLDWIKALPGSKILIKGNHDLWWSSLKKLNELYGSKITVDNGSGMMTEEIIPDPRMFFLKNDAYMAGDIAICGTRGWLCPGSDGFGESDMRIYEREIVRLRLSLEAAAKLKPKVIICALHYPPTNDVKDMSGFTSLMTEYGVKTCVYGHLHNKESFKKGLTGMYYGVEYKLVSLDYLGMKPTRIY